VIKKKMLFWCFFLYRERSLLNVTDEFNNEGFELLRGFFSECCFVVGCWCRGVKLWF